MYIIKMATYEQQMKNIKDSQQKALAGLFADIATDDAQLKSIYAKWRSQGLSQQFGFSMSGSKKPVSKPPANSCPCLLYTSPSPRD